MQQTISFSTPASSATVMEEVYSWREVVRQLLISRALDELEERELAPAGKVRYQFSARGHELPQILLALQLNQGRDAAAVYYRSRPFMLASCLTACEALCASMARAGGPSMGRDVGVVFNMPRRGRAMVLPMSGAVGTQYTPAAGYAQAIRYHVEELGDDTWSGAIAVACGGDGSTATPGFWVALNMAATLCLPLLFLIEDNGYAISVPGRLQVPGGDIVANLRAYNGIKLLDGDGADPAEAAHLVATALDYVRSGTGPALLRVRVPRLNGHSLADQQHYRSDEELAAEHARDPLPRLRTLLLNQGWRPAEWQALAAEAEQAVHTALAEALATPDPDASSATHGVFASSPQPATHHPQPTYEAGPRMNMIDAIRRTLELELERTPELIIFGEDVGRKGGVHGATRDLQLRFGEARIFDTSLAEEGIIGRAVGMALAGLRPVPEIQFRKYADPATEQLNDCGTMRWRTAGNFAAPLVVRIPVGFSKHTGDPWHSVCGEAIFAHTGGWRIVMPSNAADAVGLLRCALRGDDPTLFLEHRALLDTAEGRRPYPGDSYLLPFGRGARLLEGDRLTVVSWGALLHRCLEAARPLAGQVELLDLRTIMPWDRELVLESVCKTGRCLVVHEDTWTAGFGAELLATVSREVFEWLDAPPTRVAAPDCPVPYNRSLMGSVIPSTALIRGAMEELLAF